MRIQKISAHLGFDRLYHQLKYKSDIRSNISWSCLPNGKVDIGADVLISPCSRIGQYSYVGRHSCITRSLIGRYVSIADNVCIGPGDHDLKKFSTSSLFYDEPYSTLVSKKLSIGNDVWIGVNAVIKRGVALGHGCVVGACSIVTKSVEPFSIVVGVPARHIKYRFTDYEQKLILESEWWNYNPKDAMRTVKSINFNH